MNKQDKPIRPRPPWRPTTLPEAPEVPLPGTVFSIYGADENGRPTLETVLDVGEIIGAHACDERTAIRVIFKGGHILHITLRDANAVGAVLATLRDTMAGYSDYGLRK
jgi:hypothetical protein